MKNKLFLFASLLLISSYSFGQFSFGVSPGRSFNGGCVGYKINKNIVIMGGFQFARVSFNSDITFEELDFNDNIQSTTTSIEAKAGIFMPNIGVKHYFKQKNKIRPYTVINFAKPILKLKVSTEDSDFDKEVEDQAKKIKFWGGEWGFGTEYFVDQNFSIGGEFGIRYLGIKTNNTITTTDFDSNGDPVDLKSTIEAKAGINPTYTRFSLNFYF